MNITIKAGTYRLAVVAALQQMCHESRFTIGSIEHVGDNSLKLKEIRLKEPKLYCGNHPNACEVAGAERRYKYLEGLDWVEFNDRINDVLDALNCSANVYTSVCWIRKGRLRRINYTSHLLPSFGGFRQFWEWDRNGSADDYEDYCGLIAPNSDYPFGTPGEYLRERIMDGSQSQAI